MSYKHVYAVIRIDLFLDDLDVSPENRIKVKSVYYNRDIAIEEVNRLNNLNDNNEQIYFWQVTRLIE